MAELESAARELSAGLAFHRLGELEAAERCYQGIVQADPKHTEALKLLSVLSLDRGDLARAAAYADAALAERPTLGEYLHLSGRIKLAQGDLEGAASSLARAVAAGTRDLTDALLDLAACHARRRAWRDSLASARRVIDAAPEHLVAQRIAGYACFWLGRDAEGLAHFERVLAGEPNQAAVWNASSVMACRSGNSVAGYQRAQRACELAPDNVEYAYQRRVAAAGAVPDWHFDMLNDGARNTAFAQAITRQVRPEHLVLEIGTGAGLLALLAARDAGAERVLTCEANPVLAGVATEVIARNGLTERIRVIAKPSTQLALGEDVPERADVLICEIFSVQVITEGVLPSLEDAKARLLKPSAIIIPASAAARGALVASASLARKVRVGSVLGLDLSPLDAFSPVIQYLHPGHQLELLSEGVDLLSFDLAGGSSFPAEKRIVEVTVRAAGTCQGVVQWLHLGLVADVSFENRPDAADAGRSQHWAPVFYPFPEPLVVEVGQTVVLRVSHNRVGVRVELAGLKGAALQPELAE